MKKIIIIVSCLILSLCVGCQSKSALDSNNPVTVRLWNYYSGKQLEVFSDHVSEFNTTLGKSKGVIIDSISFGNVNELGVSVLDSIEKKVGAKEMPHIFAAYADTAYQVDALGLVEDLKPYFSDKELDEYIDGYIEEGYFDNNEELKIFPTAKSTEVMMVNMADFEEFSKATGIKVDALSTIEGVTETAKAYYEYTDGLTPTLNDGKAFFGRDAIANYIIMALKQFDHDIISNDGKTVTLDFDKETMKKVWDNYYIPYVKGYFSSKGRFRSDDVKIGQIISCVSSSSGATFFPTKVIQEDNSSHDIDVKVIEAPIFKDGKKYAVQQGAGMVVTKSDEAHQEGAVEFLKWFTQKDKNISFSIGSGYLPVTKEANQVEVIHKAITTQSKIVKDVVDVSVNTVNQSKLYVTKAFDNGTEFRNELEKCIQKQAETDRKEVVRLLSQGKDYKTVVAQYETVEYFEQWYQKTYQTLKDIVR